MIAYLDQHFGAVTAITTLVSTAFTAIYVILTSRMLREVRKAKEPFVTIDMELPDSMLRLIVVNLGQSPARNIRFAIEHDIQWLSIYNSNGIASIPAIRNGISALAPGRSLRFNAGVVHGIPKDKETVLSVKIMFEDEGGKYYSRKETIDISQFNDVLLESFEDSNKGVEEAIKSLGHSLTSKQTDGFQFITSKECPMCAERIPSKAKKCSHCGEIFDAKA